VSELERWMERERKRKRDIEGEGIRRGVV